MKYTSKKANRNKQKYQSRHKQKLQYGSGFVGDGIDITQFKKLNVVNLQSPNISLANNSQKANSTGTVNSEIPSIENILMRYPIVKPPIVNIIAGKQSMNVKTGAVACIKRVLKDTFNFAPETNVIIFDGNYGFYGYDIKCYNILSEDGSRPYLKTVKKTNMHMSQVI